jgi:hypothetical protein
MLHVTDRGNVAAEEFKRSVSQLAQHRRETTRTAEVNARNAPQLFRRPCHRAGLIPEVEGLAAAA